MRIGAMMAGVAALLLMGQAPGPRPAVPKPQFSREPNLDRSGSDIKREVLDAQATVDACEARCVATSGCVAFTFVKQSTTVPQPICWLKSTVPTGYASECCISGAMRVR